ncbi:MAG: 50S ribosomal protein L19 [Dehalococcoidia bacterium]|jgi:large subunit ribosomal protein L19|nr:50S ribosomal protein L19 [Dehalococcoidia bacterium]MDP6495266.1 50S ribosomal protein L19 [Dehalococcoidia bacterium]
MDVDTVVSLSPNEKIQAFRSGDTVKVTIRIKEGDRERLQAFQGTVIRSRGGGPGTTFTVRRVSYGIGVERTFAYYSPLVDSVEVVRHGRARQARLYYLRGRYGRAARIKEDRSRGR